MKFLYIVKDVCVGDGEGCGKDCGKDGDKV